MISVEEATQLILETAPSGWGAEKVPLAQAVGRILAEPLLADRDFPPFDRVTMDGIAIRGDAFESGKRSFRVEGVAAAGAPRKTLTESDACLEVMTGAMLPDGTDTVIRYEDLELEDGQATISAGEVRIGQNVHRQGSDRRKEECLREADTLIGPAEIGVAATIGKATLKVKKLPRVTLVATGDEIVAVEEEPRPFQIRTSNIPSLAAMLGQMGIQANSLHLPDDPHSGQKTLNKVLASSDLVIFSGGVSKGKYDYIPNMLADAGVEQIFHRVRQRPGKPFWFGKKPGGPTVFALPGNPVSTFVGGLRYVLPWLRKGLGLEPFAYYYAALAKPFSFHPELTYFLQVSVKMDTKSRMWAYPIPGKGSGDHANLSDVHGFLELPAQRSEFPEGEVFPLLLFREPT